MVVLGYDSTIPVTMEDMLHHSKAVARGASRAMIVVDLPFMSYQVDSSQAMANAARLMQEGGAHAVKLEGGETVAPTVRLLTEAGIPVMGHIGLTPSRSMPWAGIKSRAGTSPVRTNSSRTRTHSKRPEPLLWCWKWCPRNWPD